MTGVQTCALPISDWGDGIYVIGEEFCGGTMIDRQNAIEVRNVEKSFKIYTDRSNQLKDAFVFHNFNKFSRKKILKGISFNVKKGETVALVGKNGCGKSTMLKMLARILTPNAGSVELNGRVASLIELGAGFHPDLSGKENIFINASIFGIKKKEVSERLDRIIRFSELEEYIDNPVRTYSSGMYARLAFSVAISVDADILLVDEILAVGDAAFQTKCFNKMKELKEAGVTIVMVSHSLGQVQQICDRAIWIEEGLIREDGNPKEVCRRYLDETDRKRLERKIVELNAEKAVEKKQNIPMKRTCFDVSAQCGPDSERTGDGPIKIISICLLDEYGKATTEFTITGNFIVRMEYKTLGQNIKGNFSISISKSDWTYCYESYAIRRKKNYILLEKEGIVEIEVSSLNLLEGRYVLSAKAIDENGENSDFLMRVIPFTVLPQEKEIAESGIVTMPHQWKYMKMGEE